MKKKLIVGGLVVCFLAGGYLFVEANSKVELLQVEESEKAKKVFEMDIQEMDNHMEGYNYIDGKVLGVVYTYEINEKMKIQDNKVYVEERILGEAIKIDNKLYGSAKLIYSGFGRDDKTGDIKDENGEIIIDDIKVKKQTVELKTDGSLKSYGEDIEVITHESQYYGTDIEIRAYENADIIDRIVKQENKKLEGDKEYSYAGVRNIYFSDYRYFLVTEAGNPNDIDKASETRQKILDYKTGEEYYLEGQDFSDEIGISELTFIEGKIFATTQNGGVIKLKLENKKAIVENVYKGEVRKNHNNPPTIVWQKDEYVYFFNNSDLFSFNAKEEKLSCVFRSGGLSEELYIDSSRIYNDGYVILKEYKNNNEEKILLGKIEGDKLYEAGELAKGEKLFARHYVGDEGVILHVTDQIKEESSSKLIAIEK